MKNYKNATQRRLNEFLRGRVATQKYIGPTPAVVRMTSSDLSEIGYDPATRTRGCTANIKADISATSMEIPTERKTRVGYVISPSQGIFGTTPIEGFPYDYVVARYAPGSIKDLAAPIGAPTVTSAFMTKYHDLRNEALNTWTVSNVIPSAPCIAQNIDDTKYECPLFIEAQTVDENNIPHPVVLSGRFIFTRQEDHRWVMDEKYLNYKFNRAIIENANRGTPSREDALGIMQRQL